MSHSAPTTPPTPGRRSARRGGRRLNLTTALAVVLPLLCALALLAVRPSEVPEPTRPPTLTALTRSTVVCPSAMKGAPQVAMTSAGDGVSGAVRVGLGEDKKDAHIASGKVTTTDPGSGPAAVVGEDETAPGLVAARFGTGGYAATGCLAPTPHTWFTGVGAGAGHSSVLELTNPDSGTAVADVVVHGRGGVVDAPRLRGISVPGGTSVKVDLAQELPRRDELALDVVAARGRLAATVLDRYDPVGRGRTTEDWLPGQAEPATSNLLLGLPTGGAARRTLVVANGGDDEVRATVQVVTEESVFTPKGVPDLRVPPQSAAKLNLGGGTLAKLVKQGAIGLVVTANEPVTAALWSLTDGDLARVAPAQGADGASTVLLPDGQKGAAKTLLLSGATRAGAVDVVSRSASGKELASKTVDVTPDHGVTVKLPADAALVSVTPSRTSVAGAVLVSGKGSTVIPLVQPELNGLVPAVRPGLS